MTEELEVVTLTCTTCGEQVSGKAAGGGFGSAKAKLGLHNYRKHAAVKKSRTRSAQPGAPSARPIAVEVISAMAEEAGSGKAQGPPTEDQVSRAFARGVGMVSVAVASYAADTDPRPFSEQEQEQLVDYLAIDPSSARDLMAPLGRAFHRSPMNKRFGRQVVDNVDVVASIAELGTIMLHWRRYFSERARWEVQARAGGAQNVLQLPAPRPAAPTPPASVPSYQGPAVPEVPLAQAATGGLVDPNQMQGVVWTREMLEAAMERGEIQ